MAENKIENNDVTVEQLLEDARKEQNNMTTGEKIGNWFERNGEALAVLGTVVAVFGTIAAVSIADTKAKAKDQAEARRLEEKWMDTQLECARIQADAVVRERTQTTDDITTIVKSITSKE